ncbi:MAG: DNA-binding protein YbiB [Aquabacterium sp.]|uniref:DNA-binding protein YbiB n=1 Tax=Aquabacterium sp. TaxID=1872578 RepID=UPI003BE73F42
MSIAPYIKEIGRGKDGARPLTSDQAEDLMGQILDGKVTDLEIGAFCLAMRIKGETAEELKGFVKATIERCLTLTDCEQAAKAGIVVLPSYNGARKLPNLTALLAQTLARQGVGVLVHGPMQDPTRVTTAQVFQAADMPIATSSEEVQRAWERGQPAFMATEVLCPPLAKLLAVRWTIGLRNPGHTIAKLLDPFTLGHAPSMRVVNHTHPEYAHSLTDYLALTQANALLMRGTEGEPVADARRQPKFDVFIAGQRQAQLSRATQDGVLTSLPHLPETSSPDDTARYIAGIASGQTALPESIGAQASCLVAALQAISS